MKLFVTLVIISIWFHWKILVADTWSMPLPDLNQPNVVNRVAVEILTKCYTDFGAIVINDDSDKSIIESIRDTETFALILVNDRSKVHTFSQLQLKMNLFLMTPKSETELEKILLRLKNSPWWTIMTSFFILDKSNGECKNAQRMLEATWKMNVVKSFFFCVDSRLIPMIYTYNPYTNRATHHWMEVLRLSNKFDGWTMYSRPHENENICGGLDFDRTKHLDGALIKVIMNMFKGHNWDMGEYYDDRLLNFIRGSDTDVAKLLIPSLNITMWVVLEEVQDLLDRIKNGSADVAMYLYGGRPDGFKVSYPLMHSKYHIVTNNRGFYTPWEKIQNYYGIVTLISMIIILKVTFMVIVLSGNRRRWSFAGFEILRLLVNAEIYTPINTLSRRIFFSMIFLYFLIIHATFQGHLSAFLTKDEYRKNVERLEDLKDQRYDTILATAPVVKDFTDPILMNKWRTSDLYCVPTIVGKASAACITDYSILLKPAFENKMHVSKLPHGTHVYIYLIRDDWPLREKFDIFLMRLEQSGNTRWHDMLNERELDRQKRIIAQTEVLVRPISLKMLQSFIIIWLIGVILASICFYCEKRIRGKPSMRRKKTKAIPIRRAQRKRRVIENVRNVRPHLIKK